jgi:hypothetical protein
VPVLGTILLASIVLLPMLINGICDLDEPRLIFDQFQQLQRSKKLDAVLLRIAQRIEQACSHQNRNFMRLAVQRPSGLFRRQPGRELSQQPQELMLLLFHGL